MGITFFRTGFKNTVTNQCFLHSSRCFHPSLSFSGHLMDKWHLLLTPNIIIGCLACNDVCVGGCLCLHKGLINIMNLSTGGTLVLWACITASHSVWKMVQTTQASPRSDERVHWEGGGSGPWEVWQWHDHYWK